MTPTHDAAARRFPVTNEFISSDFLALASHMNDCQRSRGRFFALRASLEILHAVTSPRIVTSATLFVVCTVLLLAVA